MNIQRKQLTKRQKELVCKRQGDWCNGCPLKCVIRVKELNGIICYKDINKLEEVIKKIDEEEVEVHL